MPVGQLEYGEYNIPVTVTDSGGHGGVTKVRVILCDCIVPNDCQWRFLPRQAPNVSLGIWAILAMILGSLLLLCKYISVFFM